MQNPYAAPNHPYAQQAPPPEAGAGPQQWEPTEVIGRSWSTFGQQAGVLIGSAVVAGLILLVAQAMLGAAFGISAAAPAFEWNSGFDMDKLRRQLEDAQRLSAAALGLTVAIAAVQTFLKAGLIKIHISAARGEQPNFGDLFSGGGRFVPLAALLLIEWVVTLFGPYQMFAGSVLPWEIYAMGSLPVLVVSIWLNLALFQAQYYVVDQGLSPIDAIKRSFKDTQGEKLKLLLFWVLAFLIVLLGVLALCVGIVVALPVVWVAAALIYVRLSGTPGTPQFAGFAPPGWGPPPGGGYGPPPGGGYGPPPGGGYGPPPGGGYGGPPQGGFGGPPQGGFGGPPQGGFGGPPQGGFGGPPQGGFGGPPQGGFGGPPQGGGY